MLDYLFESNPQALTIVCIAIIIVAGFLMSRLTKLCKLPNVTGYLLAGILIGPYVLNIIPAGIIPSFSFLTDIAIAFIAFGVGKYVNLSVLKTQGKKALIITVFESLLSGILVFGVMMLFGISWEICLILASIACCTAPTSTLMTIRQYNAKGKFVDNLVQVIALDNIIGLLIFNIALAVVQGINNSLSALDLILPMLYNLLTIGLGVVLGLLLKKLYQAKHSMDSRLIMTFAIIFSLTAVCCLLNVSPLLACMTLGATYVTANGDSEVFKVVGSFTPPILLMFFVVSGMKFDITSLGAIGLVGLCYFAARIAGKVFGSFVGGIVTKQDTQTKKYLGLALIPQAGVSIGLAAIATRILPTDTASLVTTIILTAGILYELVGPPSAKHAIFTCSQIDQRYLAKNDTPIEKYIKEIQNQNSRSTKKSKQKSSQKFEQDQIHTPLQNDFENDMLESEFSNITSKEILQKQNNILQICSQNLPVVTNQNENSFIYQTTTNTQESLSHNLQESNENSFIYAKSNNLQELNTNDLNDTK